MYNWVLAMGFPIVINLSSGLICFTADQIVVSVGPYIFQSSSTRSNNLVAKLMGNASPPQSAFIGKRVSKPESINMCHVVGVACKTVIFSSFITSSITRASFAVSSLAITNVAPFSNGKNNSRPAISKEMVVIDNSLSASSIPGTCNMP